MYVIELLPQRSLFDVWPLTGLRLGLASCSREGIVLAHL